MMTKRELKGRVTESTGVEFSVVSKVVDSVLDEFQKAFVAGEDIQFRGFGSFSVIQAAAKKARNISTGEPVMVPSCKKVKFKISKEIMQEMNK